MTAQRRFLHPTRGINDFISQQMVGCQPGLRESMRPVSLLSSFPKPELSTQFAISHPPSLGIDSGDFEYLFMAGSPPPLLGMILIVKCFSELKVNCYKNIWPRWPNMAYYALSVLPSQLRAAIALYSIINEDQVYTITQSIKSTLLT